MRYFHRYWLVLLLLGFAVVACGNQTPHITDATLGTVVTASKIQDPKTTFSPTDRMIHLVVSVDNAFQTTTLGAKWYSVGASKRLLYEADAALDPFNTTADFALTSTNDWIPGNYQVIVYLDGKEERTLNFVIK